jgi:outer membrane immunogenic protein
MRRSILAIAVLSATATASFAADLPMPYKAYTPYEKVRDWTGFYAGLNLGGGFGNTKSDFSSGGTYFASASNNLTGFIGGGQFGYNWQSGPAVFGLETDIQYSGQKGSIDAPPCPALVCGTATSASYSQKMPWFGTVRGRIGYAADGWLLYATAGYAYTNLKTGASATDGVISASVNQTQFRSGWTAGMGAEMMLTANWSARVEYLYLDFGKVSSSWDFPAIPATVNSSTRFYDNIVRVGLNYRF